MAYFRAGNAESTSSFDLEAISRQADAMAESFGQKRLEAKQAIAREIEDEFREAITGSAVEDPGTLAELGERARLLSGVAAGGLVQFVEGAKARMTEGVQRRLGAEQTEDPQDRRRKEKDKEDDLADARSNLRQMLRMQAEEQDRLRAERERETIGGVEMSRADWGRLAAAIQNDERSRNWFIQHFMDQGLSREEAERRTRIIQEAAAAAAKKPEDRTPADWAAIRRGQETPGVGDAVTGFAQNQADGLRADQPAAETAALGGSEVTATNSRVDILASGQMVIDPMIRDAASAAAKPPGERTEADWAAVNRANELPSAAEAIAAFSRASVASTADAEGGIATGQSITTAFNTAASATAQTPAAEQQMAALPTAQRPAQQVAVPALNADALL